MKQSAISMPFIRFCLSCFGAGAVMTTVRMLSIIYLGYSAE